MDRLITHMRKSTYVALTLARRVEVERDIPGKVQQQPALVEAIYARHAQYEVRIELALALLDTLLEVVATSELDPVKVIDGDKLDPHTHLAITQLDAESRKRVQTANEIARKSFFEDFGRHIFKSVYKAMAVCGDNVHVMLVAARSLTHLPEFVVIAVAEDFAPLLTKYLCVDIMTNFQTNPDAVLAGLKVLLKYKDSQAKMMKYSVIQLLLAVLRELLFLEECAAVLSL